MPVLGTLWSELGSGPGGPWVIPSRLGRRVASAPGLGTAFRAVAWLLVVPQVCSTWRGLVSPWLLGWLTGWASGHLHAARPGPFPGCWPLSGPSGRLCGWDLPQSVGALSWAPPSVGGDHPGGQGLWVPGGPGWGVVVGFWFLWTRLGGCGEGRPASVAPCLGLRREEVPGFSDFEVGEGPNHPPRDRGPGAAWLQRQNFPASRLAGRWSSSPFTQEPGTGRPAPGRPHQRLVPQAL